MVLARCTDAPGVHGARASISILNLPYRARAAGRAAQRLQETVNTKGARATTVHRLLGYQSRGAPGAEPERAGSGLLPGVFTFCADAPREADAVLARAPPAAVPEDAHGATRTLCAEALVARGGRACMQACSGQHWQAVSELG